MKYCKSCKRIFNQSEIIEENCTYCAGVVEGIKIGRKRALKEAAAELMRNRSTESIRPFDVAIRYAVAFLYRKSKQVYES